MVALVEDQNLAVGVYQVGSGSDPSELDWCTGIALEPIEERRLAYGACNAADELGLTYPRLSDYENVVTGSALDQRSDDPSCRLSDSEGFEVTIQLFAGRYWEAMASRRISLEVPISHSGLVCEQWIYSLV